MKSNVLDFEPHAALFVQGNDALLFYRAITGKGFNALRNGGYLAVEINERFGQQVADLFASNGFVDVKIIRDLSGKDRIVCGKKSLKAI